MGVIHLVVAQRIGHSSYPCRCPMLSIHRLTYLPTPSANLIFQSYTVLCFMEQWQGRPCVQGALCPGVAVILAVVELRYPCGSTRSYLVIVSISRFHFLLAIVSDYFASLYLTNRVYPALHSREAMVATLPPAFDASVQPIGLS
jgi:hypothetical protein